MKKFLFILVLVVFIVLFAFFFLYIYNHYLNVKSASSIIELIYTNDIEAIKLELEKHPAAVNTVNDFYPYPISFLLELPGARYPLETACGMQSYDIVKLLLENGADCNQVDNKRKTYTCLSQTILGAKDVDSDTCYNIFKLLLENGADKDLKDYQGKTAYDYALERNADRIIQLLEGTEQNK